MWTIESELIDSPLFTQNSGAAREWRRRRRRKKGMGGRLTCDCSRCCWWRWRGRTVVVCGEERWQLLRCNLAFCLCFFFFFCFFSCLCFCFVSILFPSCVQAQASLFSSWLFFLFLSSISVFYPFFFQFLFLSFLFCLCLSSLYMPMFFKQFFLLSPIHPLSTLLFFFCFSFSFDIYREKVGREVYYPCPVMA